MTDQGADFLEELSRIPVSAGDRRFGSQRSVV
jgi:hypothetical protein